MRLQQKTNITNMQLIRNPRKIYIMMMGFLRLELIYLNLFKY